MNRSRFTDVERLQCLVQASGLDAVLATSRENVTYCGGLYDPGLRTMPNRLHVALWPAEGEPVFILPQYRLGEETLIADRRGYEFYVRADAPTDPRGVPHVHQAPIALLAETLREKGLARGRLGLETHSLPAAHFLSLQQALPEARFVDCTSLLEEARMIKTPAEIDCLAAAARATDAAIGRAFARARPGSAASELAATIAEGLLRQGADGLAFLELDVARDGQRLDFAEAPTDLRPGDLVRVDGGGYFEGYLSDVARMAVVGQPTPAQQQTYARTLEMQRRIIHQVLRPGVPGGQLYGAMARLFEEAGFAAPWGQIVHGLGLYIHERPWLREVETYTLQPGMVLCVEAIVHQPPWAMVHIEDLVLVTESGARLLTDPASAETLFVIE
ncbi:MAG: aminopeptidase P family protein [Chloroflexi bacterium]|nr:aminopeptidase P family protein [Chloroflexota bacterium]